jgi:guanylate kinase
MKTNRVINKRKGIVFILSAPSGTGKTTVISGVLERFPDISLSVSYTTRAPRMGEAPGRDYHFISHAKFLAMTAKGEFAESASVHDFFYGTPARTLNRAMASAGRPADQTKISRSRIDLLIAAIVARIEATSGRSCHR